MIQETELLILVQLFHHDHVLSHIAYFLVYWQLQGFVLNYYWPKLYKCALL